MDSILARRKTIGSRPHSRTVRSKAVLSRVEFDLREVDFARQPTTIKILAIMSTIVVKVPIALRVRTEVTPIISNVDEVRSSSLAGAPLLRITGIAIMSDVRIRTQ